MIHLNWGSAALVIGSFLTASAAAAPLPFIEIDPGATTHFRERGTHKPFVVAGVNYFDPEVGWAPKLWQQFDESRVRHHLDLLHEAGFNTIRVFLTYTSIHNERGKVDPAGLAKFRTLLRLCSERGIYVIPTGPDSWEGAPPWRKPDSFAEESMLAADDAWWSAFAREVRDEPAILAFDLLNEPSVGWDTPAIRARWKALVEGSAFVQKGWSIETPSSATPKDAASSERLAAFTKLRESIAQEWTRRKVEAIRSADRNHMISVGHIQWSAPILMPQIQHYSGFDLKENAKLLDFVTIHFYPLDWPKPCDDTNGFPINGAYLLGVLGQAAASGKPVLLGEFAWYGGGPIMNGAKIELPAQTIEDQLRWGKELIAVSRGRVCGWLNWAMADTPSSTDLTRWSGVWTTDLKRKPWGEFYIKFIREQIRRPEAPRPLPAWLSDAIKDVDAMKLSPEAGNRARLRIREAATQSQ